MKSVKSDHLEHDYRSEEQEELDTKNRRDALVAVLKQVRNRSLGTIGLVDLVEELGLEAELDEITVDETQRHRRIGQAREASAEAFRLAQLERPLE